MKNTLQIIGLMFDFAGVTILFLKTFPFRGKSSFWTSQQMVDDDVRQERKLKRWYRGGFGLLALGFLIQAASCFL
jgi:hypothetical protein